MEMIAAVHSRAFCADESSVLYFYDVRMSFFGLFNSVFTSSLITAHRRRLLLHWMSIGSEQKLRPCASRAITLFMNLPVSWMLFLQYKS